MPLWSRKSARATLYGNSHCNLRQTKPIDVSPDANCQYTVRHSLSPMRKFGVSSIKQNYPNPLALDEINILILKHLGLTKLSFLTKVLNLSLTTLQIPDVWKVGRMVPLLKPGKPANKGEFYRPITLLSLVVKTLEAFVLSTFTYHLSPADHRKVHSTTIALAS